MTIVIYRADASIEHIQCNVKIENAKNLFDYRQSKYTETLFYSLIKPDVTPKEFQRFYYVTSEDGAVLKDAISYSVDKKIITANGVDKATLSGLVEGVEVRVDGTLIGSVGTDGLVEITSTAAKQVDVSLDKFGYQKGQVQISAT